VSNTISLSFAVLIYLLVGVPVSLGLGMAFGLFGVVAVALLLGVFMGGTIGLAQILVLPRSISSALRWLFATILGQFVGVLVPAALPILFLSWSMAMIENVLGATVLRMSLATLPGASLGFFQWILLRNRVSAAAWWVPANAIGYGLSFAVAWPWFASMFGDPPVTAQVPHPLLVLLFLPAFGAVTGLTLGLLRTRHATGTLSV
jgi:hypothetical protein